MCIFINTNSSFSLSTSVISLRGLCRCHCYLAYILLFILFLLRAMSHVAARGLSLDMHVRKQGSMHGRLLHIFLLFILLYIPLFFVSHVIYHYCQAWYLMLLIFSYGSRLWIYFPHALQHVWILLIPDQLVLLCSLLLTQSVWLVIGACFLVHVTCFQPIIEIPIPTARPASETSDLQQQALINPHSSLRKRYNRET